VAGRGEEPGDVRFVAVRMELRPPVAGEEVAFPKGRVVGERPTERSHAKRVGGAGRTNTRRIALRVERFTCRVHVFRA
jgi:hypothetical protein